MRSIFIPLGGPIEAVFPKRLLFVLESLLNGFQRDSNPERVRRVKKQSGGLFLAPKSERLWREDGKCEAFHPSGRAIKETSFANRGMRGFFFQAYRIEHSVTDECV